MYNILRKGLILLIVASIFSCATADFPDVAGFDDPNVLGLEEYFDNNFSSYLYLNIGNNSQIVNSIGQEIGFQKSEIKIINKTARAYIGINGQLSDGFQIVLKGIYSTLTFNLGLFFSPSWKGVNIDGIGYWEHKDGVRVIVYDFETLVIGTGDLKPLIDNLNSGLRFKPLDSDLVYLSPGVEKNFFQSLTGGLIKGSIDSLDFRLKRDNLDYLGSVEVGLETESKARGLLLLIKMFSNPVLKTFNDPDLLDIWENTELDRNKSNVLINNIVMTDNKLVELVNKFIINKEK